MIVWPILAKFGFLVVVFGGLLWCRVAKVVGLSRKPADTQKLSMSGERILIIFCDINAVIVCFRDKNYFYDKIS